MQVENKQIKKIEKGFGRASGFPNKTMTIQRRMENAYPKLEETDQEVELKKQEAIAKKTIFAYGCSFYKLVWLFFLGSLLGDITETIFCFLSEGVFMSRSSVIYGPFSIVWGIGIVLFTIMLHRYTYENDLHIFLSGTFLGGAYEYICSEFTERVFGTVFWDYSEIPFNLGGRINLLFCFFWGFAALAWIKGIYPFLSARIEKIPMGTGKVLSWGFLIFMMANIMISGMALIRYAERNNGIAATKSFEQFLDLHYDDARMEWVYPKAIIKL